MWIFGNCSNLQEVGIPLGLNNILDLGKLGCDAIARLKKELDVIADPHKHFLR